MLTRLPGLSTDTEQNGLLSRDTYINSEDRHIAGNFVPILFCMDFCCGQNIPVVGDMLSGESNIRHHQSTLFTKAQARHISSV